MRQNATAKELAIIIRCSLGNVYRLIKTGDIDAYKEGGKWLIPLSESGKILWQLHFAKLKGESK